MFGRALLGEKFALMRLEDALQNFSTLRRLGIGDAHSRHFKALLRVPLRVTITDAQGRLGDEAEASPLESRAQFESLFHDAQRGTISFPGYDARVLIFDSGFLRAKLAQNHHHRLQNIERFETRDCDRLMRVCGNPFVRAASDDG